MNPTVEGVVFNAWAPDLFYDDQTNEFVIVWSSAIPGRFPPTNAVAQPTSIGNAHHRLYFTTMKDFVSYAPTTLLYDGGFAAIDETIMRRGGKYVLVLRDETIVPQHRNLRVAYAKHATGPYGPASAPFTDDFTEGPSVLRVGGSSYVYYDRYTRGRSGVVRTKDFVNFFPHCDSLKAPAGMRRGSAFLAPASVLKRLQALNSVAR